MARGGPERRGAGADAQEPGRGGLVWSYTRAGESFLASPAVVGNRIYVTASSMGAISESGAIYCFDADTGAVLWRSAPPGYRPTFSSPVVVGNRLVCGEGLHVTNDARVVCLDLSPGREGRVLWTFRTHSHVECTPVVYRNRVYVGAGDDGYYCLELEPAADGQAQLVWHNPGEQYLDAETSLVVDAGKVYAGLGNGGKALCVLDADTGRELARLAMPYPVFSPPSIADGKLYVGMGNGDYANSAQVLRDLELRRLREAGANDQTIHDATQALAPGGEVRCIDLATLKTDWVFKLDQTVLGCVAAAGDQLYFASRDGWVYVLSRSGQLVGKWDSRAPIAVSLAVAGNNFYGVNDAGLLFALNRQTRVPAWQFHLGGEGLFISSPVAARGHIYVGTQNQGFLCVGQPSQGPEVALWSGPLGGPGVAGNSDDSVIPPTGALHWQFPPDHTGDAPQRIVAPVAVVGDRILLPVAAGPSRGILCLSSDEAAQKARQLWAYPIENGVVLSPVVVGDRVFAVEGAASNTARQLHAVDLQTGKSLWTSPIADGASGVLAAAAEGLFVQAAPDRIDHLDLDGQKRWGAATGRLDHGPWVGDSLLVVAAAQPAQLIALDRKTGAQRWRVTLDTPPTTSPAGDNGVIYIGTSAGLEARSLTNGRPVAGWKLADGGVSGDFYLGYDLIAYISDQAELLILRRTDGSVLARHPKALLGALLGALPGGVLVSRDTLLYASNSAINRIDLVALRQGKDAQPTVWMDTSWLGPWTTPLVLKDSQLYVASQGWGLLQLGKGQ